MDENAVGTCAELVFAPIDAAFADDAPLLPSGFRIIPLDNGVVNTSKMSQSGFFKLYPLKERKLIVVTIWSTNANMLTTLCNYVSAKNMQDASSPNRTLDLASALEVGPAGSRSFGNFSGNSGSMRSVMIIAFQFAFENHLQDNVAAMARHYVRNIISSVQRVALALSPSRLSPSGGLRLPPGTPEAVTLARWICQSYRYAYEILSRHTNIPYCWFEYPIRGDYIVNYIVLWATVP